MMLFKLSLNNIKKSIKDYGIYFITLILGVCIFYIFNSIDSQTAMLKISSSQDSMIKLLIEILSYVSVFVSFILGFLIIYASRFLIKKRNKEFGIYMTLGMSKRKISFLLLVETFLIGLISLGVGLLLGIVLSQITSIFIANMFEADMTNFTFNFSKLALVKTIIYFGIIYFIVMIFNTVIINKNKLIDLLQASKKQEKIKLKNSIVCIILFITSVLMLAAAYYMVATNKGISFLTSYEFNIIILPILLGIIGTILFFYSVAGMLLKVLSKCKNLYAKKLNTFTFKQLSSKINTMVVSMSIICIMLFITLCLLSSALTIKNFFNKSLNKYAPVDFEIDYSLNFEFDDITKRYSYKKEDNISNDDLKNLIINNNTMKNNTKDITIISEYYDLDFIYEKSLGNYYSKMLEKYPFVDYNSLVEIISLSDYNKLAKLMNFKTIKLNTDEYAISANYEKEIYETVLKMNNKINIFGKELKPYNKEVLDAFAHIGGNPTNMGFFIVDDSVIDKTAYRNIVLYGNYNTKNEEKIDSMEKYLYSLDNDDLFTFDTRLKIEESSVGLSAIVTFIGLYLGIIFLISSSAILSLKQLSDSIDDKNKYIILRKIGVDEKDINKSLFKQIFIFFMMPLILAVLHTLFGLKFCTFILSILGVNNLLDGSILTFVFLIIIYGLYFIITYYCSKNIIKER